MGNDKVFKRRREQRRRREIETRTPRCETFLITSEGKKDRAQLSERIGRKAHGCGTKSRDG